ncbi:MAG TPA: phosphotransferase [Dehalococcoidia bacterium]|nr:phosphotransferase [Dehalococcoidia bacterium]
MPDDAAYVAELRDVAERAVTAWPLDVATIELISLSENAVFRIDATDGARYALRIHRPGYNSLPELESELLWTEALREAGIDVSAAVRTDDGRGYVPVSSPGCETPRQVGMVEWLDGVTLADLVSEASNEHAGARHFAELGGVIASLHEHTTNWSLPSTFVRRVWDADGLVGLDPLWGRFWEVPELSTAQRILLLGARESIWGELNDYGRDAGNFGLIHADLHAYNVLVVGDRLTAIDFDDAGFGWHQYDLAVALAAVRDDVGFPAMQRALIEGYRAVRPLDADALRILPLFQLVRRLVTLGWLDARPETAHRDRRIAGLIAAVCEEAESYLSGGLS